MKILNTIEKHCIVSVILDIRQTKNNLLFIISTYRENRFDYILKNVCLCNQC